MLPRERVFAALDFRAPDVAPLEYHPSPAGVYEHGQNLRNLWERYPGDFGDARDFPPAAPHPRWIGPDGTYREFRRDEWGVLWQHLIFGVAGHPLERPLDDWEALSRFTAPPLPPDSGPEFEAERQRACAHQQRYFLKSGWISLFEVMQAVRRFEDVLMDLATDSPEINRLGDIITDYQLGMVRYLLKRGVDAVQFGDDFGTQTSPMLSLKVWKRFFRPRYERLMRPVHEAGKKVFFHMCGQGRIFFDDFAELGVHAIWPQLNAYETQDLARACSERKMALELHPERGRLMVTGTPEEVRREVHRLADAFAVMDGGAWFYVEIDSGFPIENIRALIETIGEMRV